MEPSDDYYLLLGVDADATASDLRRAWRRLALRWHPDRAGPATTAVFQMISSAYTVLSDPIARAAYDRRRGVAPRRPAPSPTPPAPAPRPAPRKRAPGVMLNRLTGFLDTLLAYGAVRETSDGTIELVLNAEEAAQGGMVTINMRVPIHCTACTEVSAARCNRCNGTRVTLEMSSAWLAVPPEATDGTPLEPSALLRGMVRPVKFRVRMS